jgi:hypothetical protein
LWNLARELGRRLAGVDSAATQFADVAQWQQELRLGEDTLAGRQFWSRVDLDAARDLRLPLEFDRGATDFARRSCGSCCPSSSRPRCAAS